MRNQTLQNKKKIQTLFKPEILQQLKQNKFTGGLEVEWNMGEIERFSLSTNVYYNRRRRNGEDDRDLFRGFF